MTSRFSLELEQARHFVRWVTREDLSPIDKPDRPRRPSRPGGRPDYIFRDSEGRQYVLELKRLATRQLRQLEQFAARHICSVVGSHLPGTYILRIQLADPLGRGWIDPGIAESTVQEIMKLAHTNSLQDSQHLSTGFVLAKVRDDGNSLVPWVTAPRLPLDLAIDDPIAKELEGDFYDRISEADRKFREYDGTRVLLLNNSQSGLDLEFHAQRFKDRQGIMLTWAENVSRISTNLDSICLEPGISVWQANGMDRVLAGHRYTESRAGYYVELWHRPCIPRLLK